MDTPQEDLAARGRSIFDQLRAEEEQAPGDRLVERRRPPAAAGPVTRVAEAHSGAPPTPTSPVRAGPPGGAPDGPAPWPAAPVASGGDEEEGADAAEAGPEDPTGLGAPATADAAVPGADLPEGQHVDRRADPGGGPSGGGHTDARPLAGPPPGAGELPTRTPAANEPVSPDAATADPPPADPRVSAPGDSDLETAGAASAGAGERPPEGPPGRGGPAPGAEPPSRAPDEAGEREVQADRRPPDSSDQQAAPSTPLVPEGVSAGGRPAGDRSVGVPASRPPQTDATEPGARSEAGAEQPSPAPTGGAVDRPAVIGPVGGAVADSRGGAPEATVARTEDLPGPLVGQPEPSRVGGAVPAEDLALDDGVARPGGDPAPSDSGPPPGGMAPPSDPAFHVEPSTGGAAVNDRTAPFHVEPAPSEHADPPASGSTAHDQAAPTPAPHRPARPLPRIMAVANQKGGVGKTTTAVNLGAALAELGYRTLVVDLDPQGNATTGLGVNARTLSASVYDVLMRELPVEDAVEPTSVRNLFVVPATIDLAGAEIELVPAFSRELRLKRALEGVADDFDFTLIDCPPSLGLLTVNALAAATEVVVPVQCEYYALEGLSALLRNVQLVQTNLNRALEMSTIILTMYDARTKLAEQVANEVRLHFGNVVCRQVVPRTVRLSEAPSFGQPIIVFDPTSRGAIAYRELAKEVSGGTPQRVG